MSDHAPQIWLDREALRGNVASAKELIGPDCRLMFAVKSDAYGHGMDLIAPEVISSGAEELAVLDIPTAIAARSVAPDTPLLAWLLGPDDDYSTAVSHRIDLGVSTAWQLEALSSLDVSEPVSVHLKIDTGLHRNGATAGQWPKLTEAARQLEITGKIRVRAIWSHLADTSVASSRQALERLHAAADVARAAGLSPDTLHLAASHAAIELPEARLDMIRLGILGYGVSPFADKSASELGFHPVLTLEAPVVDSDDHTLLLGVGYSHGLLPPVQQASITINGQTCVVDTVGAAQTRLRCDHPLEVQPGDAVAVLGAAPGAASVEQWANWCNTIGDEVLVRLRPELARAFWS